MTGNRKLRNLDVSAVGLGAMGFSHGYGPGVGEDEAIELMRTSAGSNARPSSQMSRSWIAALSSAAAAAAPRAPPNSGLGLARVDVQLLRAVLERLRRDTELASQLWDRRAAAPEQRDRLAAELQWLRPGIGHHPLAEPDQRAQRSDHDVRKSGRTPAR